MREYVIASCVGGADLCLRDRWGRAGLRGRNLVENVSLGLRCKEREGEEKCRREMRRELRRGRVKWLRGRMLVRLKLKQVSAKYSGKKLLV